MEKKKGKKKAGNEEKFAEGECAKVWRKSDVPFRWSWQLRSRGKGGKCVWQNDVRDLSIDNDIIINVLFLAWEREK